ncbi:MAG: folylpolyglutamate synthase/dihydrofolate synthase family protein [Dehalococcoidia bacterium]
MDYVESLEWLLTLPDFERTGEFASRPDVEPMRALLAVLGDPHLARPTVHIAGSKGKGSTGAIVESILRASGKRTGYYISPHLHRYNERIRIDGKPCEQQAFASAMTLARDAIAGVAANFPARQFLAFDALTAAAFVAFRETEVDLQIVEVGLGGTLDSTNVFDATDVVIVTPISLEHTAVLGDTIAEIATQKAGIITPGATVIVAPQRESAIDVVRATADDRGATVIETAKACQLARTSASSEGQDFKMKTEHAAYAGRLSLTGRHQLDNAATAILACEALAACAGFELTPQHVRTALADLTWPGRLEVLKRRPYVIIDGAHNGDSAKRMVAALREHFGLSHATFVFGTLAGKDVAAMAAAVAEIADDVFVTGWVSARAADPRELAEAFRPYEAPVQTFSSLPDAYEAAVASAGERGAVVAFGAIAFVAALREYLLGIESDMIMLSMKQGRPPLGQAPG